MTATTTTHAPQLKRIRVAFQPITWSLVCPCGTAPSRKLAFDEAKSEMQRHPVGGGEE